MKNIKEIIALIYPKKSKLDILNKQTISQALVEAVKETDVFQKGRLYYRNISSGI